MDASTAAPQEPGAVDLLVRKRRQPSDRREVVTGRGRTGSHRSRQVTGRRRIAAAIAVVPLLAVGGVMLLRTPFPGPTRDQSSAALSPQAVAATSRPTSVSTAGQTSVPTSAPTAWTDVVAGLDARRCAALASVDEAALRSVDVAGSPAARTDLVAVRALRAAGLHPRGLAVTTTTVGVASKRQDRVWLRVVDERSAYALVDAAGTVVEQVPARGPAVWNVALQRVGDAWRTASVTALR